MNVKQKAVVLRRIPLTSFYDYEVANSENRIRGVSSWGESEALEGLHPGMGDQFRPPVLYILGELFDESGNARGGVQLPSTLAGFVGQWNYWHDIIIFPCPCAGVTHPNNGFGNGGGDGIPGNSAGKGANGRFGPIDDTNR